VPPAVILKIVTTSFGYYFLFKSEDLSYSLDYVLQTRYSKVPPCQPGSYCCVNYIAISRCFKADAGQESEVAKALSWCS
jgi:hypothetical protein